MGQHVNLLMRGVVRVNNGLFFLRVGMKVSCFLVTQDAAVDSRQAFLVSRLLFYKNTNFGLMLSTLGIK